MSEQSANSVKMPSQANTANTTATPEKQRIEFFDLAKGICILLVVWFHIDADSPRDVYINAIRMPLYFFLTGFFFKDYNSFRTFLTKKTNKLLIPFAFFYLTTAVLFPILAHKLMGISFLMGNDWRLLYAFLTYQRFPNVPLWFLWGLFILNIVFYGLRKIIKNLWLLGIVCYILYCLIGHTIVLPASINETFSGLIFFYFGYLTKTKDLLQLLKCKSLVFSMFCLFIGLGFVHIGKCNMLISPLLSITGIATLIFLCQRINHLPYISYVGRYSIIVLVTHEPLIRIMSFFPNVGLYATFAIIAASYILIIPFMRKYLPYVTAQKDP